MQVDKNRLKRLLTKDLEKAIEEILLEINPSSPLLNLCINQLAICKKSKAEYRDNLISNEALQIQTSRIRKTLLAGLDEAIEFDFKGSTHNQLRQSQGNRTGHSQLNSIKKINYFSCNRELILNIFRSRLREKSKLQPQHYFVISSSDQAPESAINRIVFEEFDNEDFNVNFRLDPINRKTVAIESIKTHGLNENGLKIELIRSLLKTTGTSADNLEELLTTDLELAKYDYVIRVFSLEGSDKQWKSFITNVLAWFIDIFCQLNHSYRTTFLFFFIVYMDAPKPNSFLTKIPKLLGKRASYEKIIDELKELEYGALNNVTVFPILQHVSRIDFEKWLQKNIFGLNYDRSKDYVSKILRELPDNKRKEVYNGHTQSFTMSFIERQIIDLLAEKRLKHDPIQQNS